MAALSDNAERKRQEGIFVSYPVAASTTIYKGALVCDDGSGYLVPASDSATSGFVFVGVAYEAANNSDGDDGDLEVRVVRTGVFQVPKSSAVANDRGAPMFARSDNEVATSTSNSVIAGVCVDIVDTSTIKLDIGAAAIADWAKV